MFITPIIRAIPKRKGEESIDFYTMPEYKKWIEENPGDAQTYGI